MSGLLIETDDFNHNSALNGDYPANDRQSIDNNNMENSGAFQLAFDLSMLGISDTINTVNDFNVNVINPLMQHSPTLLSPYYAHEFSNGNNNYFNGFNSFPPNDDTRGGLISSANGLSAFNTLLPPMDERTRNTSNITECVSVPSSEHVAEIVGRQGCKIKAIRAKTNTYIKTPVRDEEPVFVVTGRKEDVATAKCEILSAAAHFSVIRASRKSAAIDGLVNKGITTGPLTNFPSHITIEVRVPYRLVGLVVGPKGATIKHIQQNTQTYIVTPSRNREPVFVVTGMPENVELARKQIEAHIALRTNGSAEPINGMSSLLSADTPPELLVALYKSGFTSLLNNYLANPVDTLPTLPLSESSSQCDLSSTSSKSAIELMHIWKSIGESVDIDEGLGESPNIWPLDEGLGEAASIWSLDTPSISGSNKSRSSSTSTSMSPTDSLLAGSTFKRECVMCCNNEVTVTFIPCGHSSICLDCANRICGSGSDAVCPICCHAVLATQRIA